jgi:hypothetical protein
MFSTHLDVASNTTSDALQRQLLQSGPSRPRWLLAYADITAPLDALSDALDRVYPDVPVVGCTSFHGVCTPSGFKRGFGLLAGEVDDDIDFESTLVPCTEADAGTATRRACERLAARLGGSPNVLLMHATPGFEEAVLAGIEAHFGTAVPVFGGSAADDDIEGHWSVFDNTRRLSRGVVLAGFRSSRRINGGFVGGYLPGEHRAVVTRAEGRIVHELDGVPAAHVYNRWTHGAISKQVAYGGRILKETNLLPLARTIANPTGLPRRLLSHPESVLPETGSLAFFTRFEAGEEVQLMTNTKASLTPRMRQATERAMERLGSTKPLRGGLLVYCAGCLTATPSRGDEIGKQFQSVAGNVPFVGVCSFGEQGSFFSRGSNHHGNLMCSVVVFE